MLSIGGGVIISQRKLNVQYDFCGEFGYVSCPQSKDGFQVNSADQSERACVQSGIFVWISR